MMNFIEENKRQLFWIGVVIAVSILITITLIFFKTEAVKADIPSSVKLVRVISINKVDERVWISAHGVVQADKEVSLKSGVSGRVIARSSQMDDGGLVKKGEILVQIDPRDFINAVEQEQAALEKAKFDLQIEQGRQLIAEREWEKLSPTLKITDLSEELALRKPHLREKEAQLEAAKSRLEKAEIDLDRTEIRSPFDAVIVNTEIEEGDYLTPQIDFAKLAGTERFRVQVSLPVTKLEWLMQSENNDPISPSVKVIQDLGKMAIERKGYVIRLLSDLDPNGRMARVLVAVDDPLGINQKSSFPLLIGSYVGVEFEGPVFKGIFILPRSTLREEETVWVKNSADQLEIRQVNVIQKSEKFVYIDQGLQEGDQVITSSIAIPIPGMALQAVENAEGDDA